MTKETKQLYSDEKLGQPYQNPLLSEVVCTVASCVQASMENNTAASKAYTVETQRRIAEIDEMIASDTLSAEEADQQRKVKDAYIADLKEEAEKTRKANAKIVKYVSGFGGAALIVVLGCRLFKSAA